MGYNLTVYNYRTMKTLFFLTAALIALTSCSCASSKAAAKTDSPWLQMDIELVSDLDKNEPYVCTWITDRDAMAINAGELPPSRNKNHDKEGRMLCVSYTEFRFMMEQDGAQTSGTHEL